MSRFTKTDLRDGLRRLNRAQLDSGSAYFYREQGRNGYQAVDLYGIDEEGAAMCLRNVECGTSRECYAAAVLDSKGRLGRIPGDHLTVVDTGRAGRKRSRGLPTRKCAAVCLSLFIDFSKSFYELDHWDVETLLTWAKLTRYYKPKNATGSRARYFFAHVGKLLARGGDWSRLPRAYLGTVAENRSA